jgi:outer membrane protein, heavy metal efflux system
MRGPSAVWLVTAALVLHQVDLRAQEPPAAPVSLAELEQIALAEHPALAEAAAIADRTRQQADQAGRWSNPVVGYVGAEIKPGDVFRGGEHGFFVEQAIPLGGKLRLRRDALLQQAQVDDAGAEAVRLRILTRLGAQYYATLAAARRLDVQRQLAAVAKEALDVSRQLANVGAADRSDLLEAEIEERRARLDAAVAEQAQLAAWRQLAVAAGRPAMAPRALTGSLESDIPPMDYASTRAAILRSNPALRVARAEIATAEAGVRAAGKVAAPELIVRAGADYNRELLERDPAGQPRAVGWEGAAEVGFVLPILNRNQGGRAAAQAERRRAEAAARRLELELDARLAETIEAYETARDAAEVYRLEIVPRAEQSYRLLLARFRDMSAAYPQVLIAQRTLVQVTSQYVDALERLRLAATRLEGLVVE